MPPKEMALTSTPNRVNPIGEKLIREAGRESISILRGFVGPATSSVTRLYSDRLLARYIDIPNENECST